MNGNQYYITKKKLHDDGNKQTITEGKKNLLLERESPKLSSP